MSDELAGVAIAIIILREVFSFLKSQREKKNGSMNPSLPVHIRGIEDTLKGIAGSLRRQETIISDRNLDKTLSAIGSDLKILIDRGGRE